MAQTFTIIAAVTTFAAGQYPAAPVPDFAVPVGTTEVEADIGTPVTGANNLAGKAPSVSVRIGSEISYDGGATWLPGPTATRPGGVAFKKDGITPEDHLGVVGTLPDPTNPNRRIRGWLAVAGGTVRLGPATVTIRP